MEVEYLKLAEWLDRVPDDDGVSIRAVVQASPVLQDMVWRRASDPSGNVTVSRCGTPHTMRFGIGTLSGSSFPALGRKFEEMLFHGDMVSRPKEFMGLSQLYSAASVDQAQNAMNVIDAGGREQCHSIWLIGWSPRTCFGFFGWNGAAGIQVRPYRFEWDAAITVTDWRFAVRVANILEEEGDLQDLMAQALTRIPVFHSDIPFAFYCGGAAKKRLPDVFEGIPVRSVSALNAVETPVV